MAGLVYFRRIPKHGGLCTYIIIALTSCFFVSTFFGAATRERDSFRDHNYGVVHLPNLSRGSVQCVGSGDGMTCTASHACIDPQNPSILYATVEEPHHAMLSCRWRHKPRAQLDVASWKSRPTSAGTRGLLVRGTIVLSVRFVLGNFGHVLLEDFLPIIKAAQVLQADFSLQNFKMVFLDDCRRAKEKEQFEMMFGYNYSDYICGQRYQDLIKAIVPAARIDTIDDLYQKFGGSSKLDSICFERVIYGVGEKSGLIGVPASPPADQSQALRLLYSEWRERITNFRKPRGRSDKLPRVLVHQKGLGNRHGGAVLNVNALCTALSSCTPAIPCKTVTFSDDQTIEEQLELIANSDVYVSDAGSAMYYAFFLPPGSLHITFERCFPLNATDACRGVVQNNFTCKKEFHHIVRGFQHIKSIMFSVHEPESLIYDVPFEGPRTAHETCRWNRNPGHAYDMKMPINSTVQVILDHLELSHTDYLGSKCRIGGR